MSDQNFTIRLRNTRKHRINVYLEPWGEVYPLEPYTKLRVDAVGPIGVPPNNMLEIESSDDGITDWGWGGSGVTVRDVAQGSVSQKRYIMSQQRYSDSGRFG